MRKKVNCFPAVDSVIPVVTDVAKKPSKSKRIFSETINGKDDDDDDMPISTLASNAGVNHTLQQAYDSIESPIVVKKKAIGKQKKKKSKKADETTNPATKPDPPDPEFTTIGTARVRVVCIPLTEFRVSANWDPILDDSEKKSPMFLMMKSNKDENLSKNVRIEKLFGLIVKPEENRRGSQKIVKHRIAEYVHPLMKNDDKVEILNWLLHRTFKKRMHTKVIPLAHKLFLL